MLKELNVHSFCEENIALWSERWLLLASGDFQHADYNAMTVSWGSIGNVWNYPFVQVFVRPTRYTLEFMEKYPTFTVNAFPEEYRDVLNYLGSTSGRECDKLSASGLTAVASHYVAAPTFEEAQLSIECEKIYWQDFDPQHFLLPEIENHYSCADYHRVYYGRIKGIFQSA
ncbi:MAG TPA: flavin reductase [Anaerolineaceae bacterium]|nr:flavin reductase [Anaerolineaceae bacterium]